MSRTIVVEVVRGSDQPGPDGVLVAAPGVADELARLWSA